MTTVIRRPPLKNKIKKTKKKAGKEKLNERGMEHMENK